MEEYMEGLARPRNEVNESMPAKWISFVLAHDLLGFLKKTDPARVEAASSEAAALQEWFDGSPELHLSTHRPTKKDDAELRMPAERYIQCHQELYPQDLPTEGPGWKRLRRDMVKSAHFAIRGFHHKGSVIDFDRADATSPEDGLYRTICKLMPEFGLRA